MLRLLAFLLLMALAGPATAAPDAPATAATLVADRVTLDRDGRLVAEGDIVASYGGDTLTASRITYDPATETLTLDGPLRLTRADGTRLVAEAATLDRDFERGLLLGAQLILDQRVRLDAERIAQEPGLTRLDRVAATACQSCDGAPPLWSITATEVTRDEALRTITFTDARLRVRDVPVLWLPRLRLPDPGVERMSGLLAPEVLTSDRTGLGLRWPLFLTFGPSRDLTLAPLLAQNSLGADLRWRQAFRSGSLLVRASVARDDLTDRPWRGALLVEGRAALPGGFTLAGAATGVTDAGYLADYQLSDADRIPSRLSLTRIGGSTLTEAEVTFWRSLREDEPASTLPPVILSAVWAKRGIWAGGLTDGRLALEGYLRPDAEGGAPAPVEDRRDRLRLSAEGDWQRRAVVGPGIEAAVETNLGADLYALGDDPDQPAWLWRVTPSAQATLRWPLVRRGGDGVTDLIEPVAALGWTGAWGGTPANEDGRLPELDEANLFALRRLPGRDAVAEGRQLATGATWTRQGGRITSALTLGRVIEPVGPSPWLLSGRLDFGGGFAFQGRALLDGPLAAIDVGATEARLDWSGGDLDLQAAYVRLPPDPVDAGATLSEEASATIGWQASEALRLRGALRYDLAADLAARSEVGLRWQGDCVTVDLSASRRYTVGDDDPATSFGLSVTLDGFATTGGGATRATTCRH